MKKTAAERDFERTLNAAAREFYKTPWRLVGAGPEEVDNTIPEALRPYHEDPWKLLNAKPEEVVVAAAETGQAYPPGQVEAVLEVLKALREMFSLSASREVFGPDRDQLELWNDEKWRDAGEARGCYILAQKRIWRIVDRHLPGAVTELKGLWGVWVYTLANADHPNLFMDLLGPLRKLGHTLALGPVVRVFECEYCGKIGPSKRSDKRFCNGTCRKLAARKRERQKKS